MLFFYQDFLNKFEDTILGYITNSVSNVIGFITPIATSLLIIYLAIWGIAHIRGTIQEPLKEGIGRIIRIVFIISIALNFGIYSNVIVNFLYESPDQLASIVAGTPPGIATLDTLLEKGIDEGMNAWNEGGVLDGNFGMYILALIVWITTAALTAYAAFLLLLSKAALTILLAIGPIFIIMLLFQTTQKFFEGWIAQVGNFALMTVLAVALIKIMLSLFEAFINVAINDPSVNVVGTLYVFIAGVISLLVLRQIPQIAMALGGGVAISTQGVVSSALRRMPLTSWMMATRPTNIARSARGVQRDIKTLGAPGRAAGNLYRRRFGGNSVSGR
jgi:type IV secretion system protein VirB6